MGTKPMGTWPLAPTVALMGPTGVGKSALALTLAEHFGLHIVNGDSVQCYRGFDIGSAKPTPDEQALVPHHLLDVADAAAGEAIDAQRFARQARACLQTLSEQGAPAILCGGTGLYVRVVRDGLIDVGTDLAWRRIWLQREAQQAGVVYAQLQALDPQAAARIGPHNPARLLRALEIRCLSGRSSEALFAEHKARTPVWPLLIVWLDAPDEMLRSRLRVRAEAMLAQGLLGEVRARLAQGVSRQAAPMRAVGYREAAQVVCHEAPEDELLQRIVARSWQYVRRQRTWLRREPVALRLDATALWPLLPQQQVEAVWAALQEVWARRSGP